MNVGKLHDSEIVIGFKAPKTFGVFLRFELIIVFDGIKIINQSENAFGLRRIYRGENKV